MQNKNFKSMINGVVVVGTLVNVGCKKFIAFNKELLFEVFDVTTSFVTILFWSEHDQDYVMGIYELR